MLVVRNMRWKSEMERHAVWSMQIISAVAKLVGHSARHWNVFR